MNITEVTDLLMKELKKINCESCRWQYDCPGLPPCDSCQGNRMQWGISEDLASSLAAKIVQSTRAEASSEDTWVPNRISVASYLCLCPKVLGIHHPRVCADDDGEGADDE